MLPIAFHCKNNIYFPSCAGILVNNIQIFINNANKRAMITHGFFKMKWITTLDICHVKNSKCVLVSLKNHYGKTAESKVLS